MLNTKIIVLLVVCILCMVVGCDMRPIESAKWSPVYGSYEGQGYPSKDHWRYRRSLLSKSQTLTQAKAAFEQFLSDPNNYAENEIGCYEDASHSYAMETAKYELMRIYYQLGMVEQGDNILRHLDPLELLPKEGMFILRKNREHLNP